MKTKNPYKYNISGLKNFSESRISDVMAMSIVALITESKTQIIAQGVARYKIRKMFIFGYAKALYDIDKKKHKKLIKILLKRAEQLDSLMVHNFKQKLEDKK